MYKKNKRDRFWKSVGLYKQQPLLYIVSIRNLYNKAILYIYILYVFL